MPLPFPNACLPADLRSGIPGRRKRSKPGCTRPAVPAGAALSLALALAGCAGSAPAPKSAFVPHLQRLQSYPANEEYDHLVAGFEQQREDRKRAFFAGWKRESDSIGRIAAERDEIERDIHAIYRLCFRPDTTSFSALANNLQEEKASDTGLTPARLAAFLRNTSAFPRDAKYLVLPPSIAWEIWPDSLFQGDGWNHRQSDSARLARGVVQHFHPRIDFYGKPILLLTEKYEQALDKFLLLDFYADSSSDSIGQWRRYDTMMRRRKFLRPEIEMATMHWDAGWHYLTFPAIWTIRFDEHRKRARASFRLTWNSGGGAEYARSDSGWQEISRGTTWIE